MDSIFILGGLFVLYVAVLELVKGPGAGSRFLEQFHYALYALALNPLYWLYRFVKFVFASKR